MDKTVWPAVKRTWCYQSPYNPILKCLACNADLGTRAYISLVAMDEVEDDTEDYNASIHDA